MFRKFFLSFGVIGMFVLYSLHIKNQESEHQVVAPASLQNPSEALPATPVPSASPSNPSSIFQTSTPSSTPAPAQKSGAYKDGAYTGSSADAFYGNIQVKAIISGGKITDVVFLDYPQDRGTSIMINTQAMPYLKQEAIAAQNANVDIVSGATDSSLAFKQSLQSALDQAKI